MKHKKDDGVSNVVGEMLLLAIAIVLVAVFAVSFFGLLPGERAEVIEFTTPDTANPNEWDTTSSPGEIGVKFQHIWGDFIPASELRIIVYDNYVGDNKEPLPNTRSGVTDGSGNAVLTLDLGNYAVVWFSKPTTHLGDEHTFTFVLTGENGILEEKTVKWMVPSS